ncbi:succinate dehydrogenase cytochrome b subunit [Tessaracoccus sp. OH4464_COT-324]|uniref:succinate dehydrogenase cytochrome b subunit n=1 Tax=Tessaracoccus sp. OH4464_COT-324 TaxID=2491059 RepID=UPI000F63043D|nr:succinate dehydrogenase cytochrome b subunit [Tessaracoccus sp. OH4464_COT-324]
MRSTVVRKFIMAVTGLIMIGFLLMHMYGNLKMFLGAHAFDHYAHWLKGATEDGGILYPIMPAGTFIWVFRAALLLAIVLHFWSAVTLWQRSAKAAGPGYQNTARLAQTYSARTMRWGGIIVLLGLIVHLLQFTVIPGQFGGDLESPFKMVVHAFTQPWFVALYAVWMVLVCMHIRHGFWSAFATLGLNLSAKSRKILNCLAMFVAVVLYVGFMIMPVSVFVGWIG